MSRACTLYSEDVFGRLTELGHYEGWEAAEEAAGRLFDEGNEDDYRVIEDESGASWAVPSYRLHKEPCPECGKDVRSKDLIQTHDYHGIPFRWVCPKCYDRIMGRKGYDGEQYSEADECLDYDY